MPPNLDLMSLLTALRSTPVTPVVSTIGQVGNQAFLSQGAIDEAKVREAGGMNKMTPEQDQQTGDTGILLPPDAEPFGAQTRQIVDPQSQLIQLMSALRLAPSVQNLLSSIGGIPANSEERKMPGPGFIPGELHLDRDLAPGVPVGAPRPFAPGEYIRNPDGTTSSEISITVSGDPTFNGGRPTLLPSLWIKDGKPYVAKNDDEAVQLAKASGLNWTSIHQTNDAADAFANQREAGWNKLAAPGDAIKVAPLYQPTAREFIEPPAASQGP